MLSNYQDFELFDIYIIVLNVIFTTLKLNDEKIQRFIDGCSNYISVMNAIGVVWILIKFPSRIISKIKSLFYSNFCNFSFSKITRFNVI